jgi:hypothetical protein
MGKLVDKAARHYRWARTEGVRRLIEEDQLDPRDRARTAWSKAKWRRETRRRPGEGLPVFVVGLQRSGTNMLVRGFESAPEVEVHNENDRRAFREFRLRSDEAVRSLVAQSRHDYILFKPLCDSHRTVQLLEGVRDRGPGHAIWVYREVDGRVRSSVAKFGTGNLDALRAIAAGDGADRWEAGGLSSADLDLLRSLPVHSFSPESASALFWYLRNGIFFSSGLHERGDVSLVSYDAFVSAPAPTMSALCARVGFPYRAELIAGIEPHRSPAREPLKLDPDVRTLCQQMQSRLDTTSRLMLATV